MAHKSSYRQRRKAKARPHLTPALRIRRRSIPKALLAAIPKPDRALLFLAGHVHNELYVFGKMAVAANATGGVRAGPRSQIELGQAMIVMRIWMAKVHEGWLMFKNMFQGVPTVTAAYLPLFNPEELEAKDRLNNYFGRSPPLKAFRDATFHMPNVDQLDGAFMALPEDDAWVTYAGRAHANMFAASTEVLVSMALDAGLRGGKVPQTLPEFMADVHRLSNWLTTVLSACERAILSTYFPAIPWEDGFEVPHPPRLEELRFPFFVDEASLASPPVEDRPSPPDPGRDP